MCIRDRRHTAEDSQRAVNLSFGCGNSRNEKVVRHVETVAEIERTSTRKRLVDEERCGTVAHANSESGEFYLRTHHVLGLSLYLLAKDSVRPHFVARCRRLLIRTFERAMPRHFATKEIAVNLVVDEFSIIGEKRQEHEALGSHAPRCGSSEEVRFQQRLEIVDVDVAVAINHLKTGTVVVVAVLVRRKPKGRFFRSVKLYLTEIMIDICRNWRKFWRKGAYAFGGIGRIGLIRPIGHQPVDSPTCKLVDPLTC